MLLNLNIDTLMNTQHLEKVPTSTFTLQDYI